MASLDFLMSRRLQRILGALFLNPERRFSLSDLIRIGGEGRGATQNVVASLYDARVVTDERSGNQRLFSVNKHHPLYQELRSICLKSFGLADRIRDVLLPFEDRIESAFIFGSIATGKDTAASDIDLLLIGDVDIFEINAGLAALEQALGRQIHANVYGLREWERLEADKVVGSILSGPKIMVMGHEPGRANSEPDQDRNLQGSGS